MFGFYVCNKIVAIENDNMELSMRFDYYRSIERDVLRTETRFLTFSRKGLSALDEFLKEIARHLSVSSVRYSDDVLTILRTLFTSGKVDPLYVPPKPTVTITSYLLDSESLEFTTSEGVIRVKEKESIVDAYRELVVKLTESGKDVTWIKFIDK